MKELTTLSSLGIDIKQVAARTLGLGPGGQPAEKESFEDASRHEIADTVAEAAIQVGIPQEITFERDAVNAALRKFEDTNPLSGGEPLSLTGMIDEILKNNMSQLSKRGSLHENLIAILQQAGGFTEEGQEQRGSISSDSVLMPGFLPRGAPNPSDLAKYGGLQGYLFQKSKGIFSAPGEREAPDSMSEYERRRRRQKTREAAAGRKTGPISE
jgi:hypothetical protein